MNAETGEFETWTDLVDVVNEMWGTSFTESKPRKDYQTFKKMLPAYIKTHSEKEEYFKEIEAKKFELRKETQKFYDQRREYNKIAVAEARAEHLEDRLIESANKLNEICPFINANNLEYAETHDGVEAVIYFADWHYGMTTDNIFNQYNIDICKKRVNELVNMAIKKIKLHRPEVLHVCLLGDAAHGACHVSARVESEEKTSDQLMQVSELIAEAIDKLSQYVCETRVYSTYGNHMRTIQNKKDSVHADNMEKVVSWWLKQRFKDRNDIIVEDSEFYEFIKLNVAGKNIVCTHGDLDGIKNIGVLVNTIFTKLYGETIDYTVSADKHHVEQFESLGIDNTIVPALCGSDGYANDHRLYSNPGQTLMIFNKECGKDAVYNIVLH